MRRVTIVLLTGIALQGLGGAALIAWWTREEPRADAPATGASAFDGAVGAPTDVARPSLLEEAVVAREAVPTPQRPAANPARPRRIDRTLREGTPPERRQALRAFRREMKATFAALQRRVAKCDTAQATFTLALETVEGGVRVVDAHLDAQGSASDAGLACARAALLGATIAGPAAERGRRWQLAFAPGSAL